MFADINECTEGIDDCSQICTDTDGSYICSCAPGYLLTNDSRGCDGILNSHSTLITQLSFVTHRY